MMSRSISISNRSRTMTFKLASLIVLLSMIALLQGTCGKVDLDGMSMGSGGAPRLRTSRAPSPAATAAGTLSTPIEIRQTPWRPPVVNINYFKGPVMSDPIVLYIIWYGKWPASYKAVVRTLMRSLTPSEPIKEYPNLANWWKIVTEYTQDGPHGPLHVSDSVSIGAEIDDVYSLGKNLTTTLSLPSILRQSKLAFPVAAQRTSALYVLLTDREVRLTDSTGNCGFHNILQLSNSKSGHDFMWYAYAPLASTVNGLIQEGCNNYLTNLAVAIPRQPPNKDVDPSGALDSMVSALLHEIAEAATDPSPSSGWIVHQPTNTEAGDLCNRVYGGGDYTYCGMPDVYGAARSDPFFTCESFPYSSQFLQEKQKRGVIYNLYGVNASQFLIQQWWSVTNKACQLQRQEPCKGTVTLTSAKGLIQVGVFINSKGQQTYAPGANCTWNISVPNAKNLTLQFENVATGYDRLDHIDVYEMQTFLTDYGNTNGTFHAISEPVLKSSISEPELDQALKLHIEGSTALVHFTSYGARSPYPEATGFQLRYNAEF